MSDILADRASQRTLFGLVLCASALAGGCSALFVPELPPGCDAELEDLDEDGWLVPECVVGGGVSDCDDDDTTVHPGAEETCNFADDDCDGKVDEGLDTREIFADCDGDGVGQDFSETVCGAPQSFLCPDGHETAWVNADGDCDDNDPNRHNNCGTCAQVDLLVVMDSSGSMLQEQDALAGQIGAIVEALRTGDIDGDMMPEGEAVQDMHVGVITPDLGVGTDAMPRSIPSCDPAFGDDGLLRTESAAIDESCDSLPLTRERPYLSFIPGDGEMTPEQFAHNWSCLVQVGVGGCGFEHPLEATLKALTPAASRIRFRGATLGHEDGLNSGFLREDSLLVIVVITDEDDCSVQDFDLLEGEPELNLRCHARPDALSPISRYVSGLLEVRDAEDLIFALVVGVPSGGTGGVIDPNIGELLSLPALEERVDGTGTRLAPSCVRPTMRGGASAFPPRRLLETAAGLAERGSTTVLSSICGDEPYRAVAAAILQSTVAHSGRRCLSRL